MFLHTIQSRTITIRVHQPHCYRPWQWIKKHIFRTRN